MLKNAPQFGKLVKFRVEIQNVRHKLLQQC